MIHGVPPSSTVVIGRFRSTPPQLNKVLVRIAKVWIRFLKLMKLSKCKFWRNLVWNIIRLTTLHTTHTSIFMYEYHWIPIMEVSKKEGTPNSSKSLDQTIVLRPMTTWGSPILRWENVRRVPQCSYTKAMASCWKTAHSKASEMHRATNLSLCVSSRPYWGLSENRLPEDLMVGIGWSSFPCY